MNNAVDSSSGGQRVLEDLVPLGENEIGGDDDRATFIAFSNELFIMRYSFLVTDNG